MLLKTGAQARITEHLQRLFKKKCLVHQSSFKEEDKSCKVFNYQGILQISRISRTAKLQMI
jgi:hypothetical protein